MVQADATDVLWTMSAHGVVPNPSSFPKAACGPSLRPFVAHKLSLSRPPVGHAKAKWSSHRGYHRARLVQRRYTTICVKNPDML